MLLLRGGNKGTDEDFCTDDVSNSPILEKLPYISTLLSEEGPFRGAVYAFIFRTKPHGITRAHYDDNQAWMRKVRIHVPIISNDRAVLLSEKRAMHFAVGSAWTFDNQTLHSVVNGDKTRVHMIFDVNPNPKLAEMMAKATFDPGEIDMESWNLTIAQQENFNPEPLLMFARGEPLDLTEKNSLGLNPKGFATRVTHVGNKGKLLLTPLREGDIVTAVNGVDESVLSRTALDHIAVSHKAGEKIVLNVINKGKPTTRTMRLKPENYFSLSARLKGLTNLFGAKQRAAY